MEKIQSNIYLIQSFKQSRDWGREGGGGANGRKGVLIFAIGNNVIISPWKAVYHQEYQKIHQKFQYLLKTDLIVLANTANPDLKQYHLG